MDPYDEIALLIKAAHRQAEREVNEALRPIGLTAAQLEALLVLGSLGPLSLGELGGLLVAEGGLPSRLVDRLVTAGLVDRQPSQEDRRRVQITISLAGRQAAARGHALTERVRARFAATTRHGDLPVLRRLLEDYLDGTRLGDTVHQRRSTQGDRATAGRGERARPTSTER